MTREFVNEKTTTLFWRGLKKSLGNGCWTWRKAKTYGRISLPEGSMQVHRYSWLLHFGIIKNGLHVCHKCDNPKCVRPDHLFLGTDRDNVLDSVKKGRFKHGPQKNTIVMHPRLFSRQKAVWFVECPCRRHRMVYFKKPLCDTQPKLSKYILAEHPKATACLAAKDKILKTCEWEHRPIHWAKEKYKRLRGGPRK